MLIPFIYNDANEGFLSLFIAYSAEIPAIIFVTLLIDNKQFGRKRLCIFGLLLIFLVELIFYLVGEDIIVESVIIIRFGVRVVWSCLNVIPAESYPTKYRSLGNGAA